MLNKCRKSDNTEPVTASTSCENNFATTNLSSEFDTCSFGQIPDNSDLNNTEISTETNSELIPLSTSTPDKEKYKISLTTTATSPSFPNDRLFSQSLNMSPTRSLDKQERHMSGYFIQRGLFNSKDGIFEVDTGRKKIRLAKIPKREINSADAKPSTIKKRQKIIENIINHVAGSSDEAVTTHQAHTLKRFTPKVKTYILHKAGIKETIKMNSRSVLEI